MLYYLIKSEGRKRNMGLIVFQKSTRFDPRFDTGLRFKQFYGLCYHKIWCICVL